MIILQNIFKRLSLAIEYTCFLVCLFYWFFYSLARVRGVPLLFDGIHVNSGLSGLLVLIVLFFNGLFFSRLFLELATKASTLRYQLATRLLENALPLYLFLFFIAFATGGRFDYASYKLQWGLIIGGGNPWGPVQGGMVNAYGYVFNFFSILYSLHSLLPKLFFVILLLVFNWRLTVSPSSRDKALILFLCVNPFTVSILAVYGFVDGACSLLLGLALLEDSLTNVRSSFKSGIFLALSVLTKFYSLVALPLLMSINRRQKQLFRGFLTGYLLTFLAIIVVSYILWGDSILDPLLFAKGRDPSFLTIWKYVPHSELRTPIFSIVSVFAITKALTRYDLSVSYRTAAVLSIIFGTYYLGHQQFYLAILVSLAVYIAEVSRDTTIQLKTKVLRSFALMLGWLIFIQAGFELFDEFKPVGFQNLMPFLSLLNSLVLAASGYFWLSTKPTLEVSATSRT